uniref:Uncharacterized protein n=1 Tax=Caenorhabditis japonica TaxID=281687 RepID=A0A8R1EMN2_CAEJA
MEVEMEKKNGNETSSQAPTAKSQISKSGSLRIFRLYFPFIFRLKFSYFGKLFFGRFPDRRALLSQLSAFGASSRIASPRFLLEK